MVALLAVDNASATNGHTEDRVRLDPLAVLFDRREPSPGRAATCVFGAAIGSACTLEFISFSESQL